MIMKGIKIDNEFVSTFIEACVKAGNATPSQIILEARSQLNLIDEKIKEVEILKKNRSKILGVISTLEKIFK
jgi:hypothetical protein